MKRVLILPNYLKEQSVDMANTLSEYFFERGYDAKILEENGNPSGGADLAVVLGGDGTILRACKKLYGTDTAIFGINFGHMGYLTGCGPDESAECLDRIINGDYKIENRMMLKGSVFRNGNIVYEFAALNEATLYRAKLMRAFTANVSINGKHTEALSGDGMLVATPTGSTSYNLTAGGPVLTPDAENLVITPIASKYFPQSSIVVSGNDKIGINVEINSAYEKTDCVSLEVDADESFDIRSGDVIQIEKAEHCAKIIKVDDKSFYQILREKLSADGNG